MRRSSSSVVLNLAEGMYSQKGNRLARYQGAMASAGETRGALQLAEVTGTETDSEVA
jgi:four helix bundle protein